VIKDATWKTLSLEDNMKTYLKESEWEVIKRIIFVSKQGEVNSVTNFRFHKIGEFPD